MSIEEKDLVIKNLITKILITELGRIAPEKNEEMSVTSETRIKEDLDLDSLEVLELIIDMEGLYDISIDNSLMDFRTIKTVEDLAACLAPRIGGPVKSI